MSEQFKDYVTGGAFHLSLSKRQVEMLGHLYQFGSTWGYLSSCNALIAKGLAERIDEEDPGGEGTCLVGSGKVVLSEAGKALMPLLILAGLYQPWEMPQPVEIPPVNIRIKRRDESEVLER
ncbi:hypothetical protein ACOTEY_00550 [Achromobacter xylosoxidans]